MQALVDALGMGAQVADIERIRRILGKQKLILIGHSFGGFIAALYAAEFTERVEKLVLVAPADLMVMPPAGGGLYEQVRRELPEGEARGSYERYLRRYFDFSRIFEKDEAELAALNLEFTGFYARVMEAQGLRISGAVPDSRSVGGWHSGDISDPHGLGLYTENLRDATLVRMNCGHFAYLEAPEELAGAVAEFLAR